jgi:hypothetical protein
LRNLTPLSQYSLFWNCAKGTARVHPRSTFDANGVSLQVREGFSDDRFNYLATSADLAHEHGGSTKRVTKPISLSFAGDTPKSIFTREPMVA